MITGKKPKTQWRLRRYAEGWSGARGNRSFWQHSECVARLFARLGTTRRLRDVTKRTQKHKKKSGREEGLEGGKEGRNAGGGRLAPTGRHAACVRKYTQTIGPWVPLRLHT